MFYMVPEVDKIAVERDKSLKSWVKPELTRVEFGEAENGQASVAADAGTLS